MLCTSDPEITNPNLNEVGNDTNAARACDVQLEGGQFIAEKSQQEVGDEGEWAENSLSMRFEVHLGS